MVEQFIFQVIPINQDILGPDTPGISKLYWSDSHIVKYTLRNTNWSGINIETEGGLKLLKDSVRWYFLS